MFTQTFIDETEKTKKPLAVFLSLLLQASAIVLLILIPLVYTQALPNAQLKSQLVAPAPPPPATTRVARKVVTRSIERRFNIQRLVAPVVIPKTINHISDAASALDIPVVGDRGVPGGVDTPGVYGLLGSVPQAIPPAPPAPQPKARGPVKISSGVSEANLVRRVQPVYPPLARSARIQGTVEFTATISKEGNIENLQLVRGHPLLVNAAREAVLQWKYRPTLLNGQPVEVITDIVVNFTLSP